MTTHKENIETIRTLRTLQREADRKIRVEKAGQHRPEVISNIEEWKRKLTARIRLLYDLDPALYNELSLYEPMPY